MVGCEGGSRFASRLNSPAYFDIHPILVVPSDIARIGETRNGIGIGYTTGSDAFGFGSNSVGSRLTDLQSEIGLLSGSLSNDDWVDVSGVARLISGEVQISETSELLLVCRNLAAMLAWSTTVVLIVMSTIRIKTIFQSSGFKTHKDLSVGRNLKLPRFGEIKTHAQANG